MSTRRCWIIGLWAVLQVGGIVRAQESTPDVTAEATSEATPEATPYRVEFPGPGGYTLRGTMGRFERVYRVYIPASYEDAAAPVPLLFVFHGAGGDGVSIAEISAFNDLADQEGFVAVYPDGINRIWNDGRPPDPSIGPVDDLGFVTAIIEGLMGGLSIDPNRIYAAGFSAGGMFAFRLGCELPDHFAAVASVASTFPEYLMNNCDDTPPMPVLVIQGTDDPIIPWTGVSGGYLSAAATLDFWEAHNNCKISTGLLVEADTNVDDGTRILSEARNDCADGADVQLYGVFFGGHTWPSHPIQASIQLGVTSMDIDASQVIWNFFAAHPKPQ